MAKKDKYIKSNSLFTIKNIHAKTNAGTIYENDYVTIINNDGIYNDEMALFSDSNFKFKISTNNNDKKRHIRTNFIKPENGEEYWTKKDINNQNISEESKIVLKSNYNSLKDFAYYSSAVELIKATINDIVLRFPGGLYYYEKNYAPEITINGIKYLLISNECQIDCWSKADSVSDDLKNKLRVLSLSYKEYNMINEPIINITGSCLDSIIGSVKINEETFQIYNDNNNQFYLVLREDYIEKNNLYGTTIIEPIQKHFDLFWDNLDDFERVIFNKDSIPLYTAIFDTPFKTENGFYYTPKSYTWPTIGDSKTPDLTTSKFNGYLSSLLSLAEFHDEYDSDNMWRMMTHESIKNLDWTYSSDENEFDDIDNSKIKALIHIQGRIYDDIKRYIDNIKYTNSLSYNQKNNTPDYFLSDINENNGWEAKNTTPFETKTNFNINYNANKSKALLEISGKTSAYVNSAFLRRLALSSNYIQSMKGTRKGIEAILGMFGYNENDYEITEYIASASCETFPLYDKVSCLRAEFDYVNSDENTNFMKGYPVAIVENENKEFILIPWFDQNEIYEDNFYFQSKGGWGKVKSKEINNLDLTTIKEINSNNLYTETEPYILFLDSLDDLISIPNNKIKNGMVCYVSNIKGMDLNYNKKISETSDYSHYFILENEALSTKLGYIDVSPYKCYGWYNIKESEYNGTKTITDYGKKVLYLETISPYYKSNNPHTGKGNYDFGEEYLFKFSNLFDTALKSGKCDKLTADKKNEIAKVGFGTIKTFKDNEKCKIVIDEDCIIGKNIQLQTLNDSFITINVKNLSIKFKTNSKDNAFKKDFKKYIKEVVMPYLEVMIPSTTIFEILFDDENPTIITVNNENNITYSLGDIISEEPTDIWVEDESWKNNIKN